MDIYATLKEKIVAVVAGLRRNASPDASYQGPEAKSPKTCSIDHIIGVRLRRKRMDRSIAPEQFAASIGVSEQALLAMEAGAERIDALVMREMCKALDVSPKYFFEPWTKRQRVAP